MPEISVIVPVYNVEKYLNRCIDSILAQTFTDFELILVDDGSTDKSGEICDEYANDDCRIKVVHNKNEGVSIARNIGLDNAVGEFITFCDSDDYWDEEWLMKLFLSIKLSEADVVVANCITVEQNGIILKKTENTDECILTNTISQKIEYIINCLLVHKQGWEIWRRIFRSDIIKKNNIRFCTTCNNYAEDLAFVLEYSLYCAKIQTVSAIGYYYVIHTGSIMNYSRNIVKLNEMNEVSAFFFKVFKREVKEFRYSKQYPIIHFLILHAEYAKIIGRDNYKFLSMEIDKVQRKKWYAYNSFNIFFCYKELKHLFGKKISQQILLFSLYCLHRNWRRFKIESAIAYKWFIREK